MLKYLDAKLVEDMHRALGMPPPNENTRAAAAHMNDDMIEEDMSSESRRDDNSEPVQVEEVEVAVSIDKEELCV